MSDVEALLNERAGYVVRGLANRVAQIDAELERMGVAVDDEPAVETATREKPQRRRR